MRPRSPRPFGPCLLLAVLVAAGCASTGRRADGTPDRSRTRNLLIGAAVVTAGLAAGAAILSANAESSLRDDVAAGRTTGADFADRDEAGRRWNRAGRFAAFATGLSLVGLAIVWETGIGDRIQMGPAERTPADDKAPLVPVPGAGAPPGAGIVGTAAEGVGP
jgi:hypothetical protein